MKKQISCMIGEEVFKKIKKKAEREDRSDSWVINDILDKFFKGVKK